MLNYTQNLFFFIPFENLKHQNYFKIKYLFKKMFKTLKKNSEIIGKYMSRIFFLNRWELKNNHTFVKNLAFLSNSHF